MPGLDAEQYWGVERGAGYRMEVPDDWNGSLVMWANGFRGEGLELTVDNHPLRTYLLANGYAWAASSCSETTTRSMSASATPNASPGCSVDRWDGPTPPT